jgi:hypothetical protein
VLKNPFWILGLASLVTCVAAWPAGPQAVTAGEVSQARLAVATYDCPRCPTPRPELGEKRFGPYGTFHEAKQKRDALKHDGWRDCRMQECYECHVWYVFARRNHR